MRRIYAVFFVIVLLGSGCVSPRRTPGGSGGGGGGGGGTGGQLYVSASNSILHFNNAETSNGNVANQGGGSILVFDNASTLNGNIAPTRVISGNATHLASPIDVALDATNNLLYVADGTSILVFASALTVSGNTAPVRNINLGATMGGLFLDATNNQLYVTDPGDNTVDRLDSASTQDVVGIVGGAIAGVDTKLSQPRGLVLDGSGRIIVSNSATPVSITVYPNASTATGDVIPVATISGSNTRLQAPGQIALNRSVANGELYVLDPTATSILIFTNLSTANGNVTPARTISGSNTGLTAINGLAIDPTR